jgi:hypothetical protein
MVEGMGFEFLKPPHEAWPVRKEQSWSIWQETTIFKNIRLNPRSLPKCVLSFDAKKSHGVILDRALEIQRSLACEEGANFLGLKSGEAFHILSRSDQGGLNFNSSECMWWERGRVSTMEIRLRVIRCLRHNRIYRESGVSWRNFKIEFFWPLIYLLYICNDHPKF